ncbi:hypothetical protein F4780DRAFT_188025 [Xylariomycetidae sp. FL0641]|nr:hypothetical protein F4780DRAFT_188025 [Xylariomycetidae sp. FL0641]
MLDLFKRIRQEGRCPEDNPPTHLPFEPTFPAHHHHPSRGSDYRHGVRAPPGMRTYAEGHLCIGGYGAEFTAQIIEKASGVFLWVKTVIPELNKAFDAGNIPALQTCLRKTPSRLAELWRQVLSTDRDDIQATVSCLTLVFYTVSPLTPAQLLFGIRAALSRGEALQRGEIEEATMLRYIVHVSSGLVEQTAQSPPTIQFIHESVRDFLGEHGFKKLCPGSAGNVHGAGHERMKQVCLRQLYAVQAPERLVRRQGIAYRRESLGMIVKIAEFWYMELDNLIIGSSYPFLEYAAKNILIHADQAQGLGLSQENFVADFPLPLWMGTINAYRGDKEVTHYSDNTLLHIFVVYNLCHLIRIHPDR